jgi:hypothetical protein
MEAISVVTEVQRRQRFPIKDKLVAAQEYNEPGMTVLYAAHKYSSSQSPCNDRVVFGLKRPA